MKNTRGMLVNNPFASILRVTKHNVHNENKL